LFADIEVALTFVLGDPDFQEGGLPRKGVLLVTLPLLIVSLVSPVAAKGDRIVNCLNQINAEPATAPCRSVWRLAASLDIPICWSELEIFRTALIAQLP
jgi:hypothetical protein